jgi:hypothetical protein
MSSPSADSADSPSAAANPYASGTTPGTAAASPAKFGPRAGNPALSNRSLTFLLIALAVVPSLATVGIWSISPRVGEGALPTAFLISGMPSDPNYYAAPAEVRHPLDDAKIEIRNTGPLTLSQINVIINHSHEIRDPHKLLEPGESVVYRFNRFYNRAGFTFHPELSPVKHLRIFAKQGDRSRASFNREILPADYDRWVNTPQP